MHFLLTFPNHFRLSSYVVRRCDSLTGRRPRRAKERGQRGPGERPSNQSALVFSLCARVQGPGERSNQGGAGLAEPGRSVGPHLPPTRLLPPGPLSVSGRQSEIPGCGLIV